VSESVRVCVRVCLSESEGVRESESECVCTSK